MLTLVYGVNLGKGKCYCQWRMILGHETQTSSTQERSSIIPVAIENDSLPISRGKSDTIIIRAREQNLQDLWKYSPFSEHTFHSPDKVGKRRLRGEELQR